MKGDVPGDAIGTAAMAFCMFIGCIILVAIVIQITPLETAGLPTSSIQYKTINYLGNTLLLNGLDSIGLIIDFCLIIGMFVSGYYQQSDFISFGLGIVFMIPIGLLSMGLSDAAHLFATSSGIAAATQYLQMQLFFMDNLPIIIVFSFIVYCGLILARNRMGGSPSGSGGMPIVSG